MRTANFFVVIGAWTLGCGDTPAEPLSERGIDEGIENLAGALRRAGADVHIGGSVQPVFFSIPGRELTVNGESVQAFVFRSPPAAARAAAGFSPDASTYRDGSNAISVYWIAPPHVFRKDETLAMYIGARDDVVGALTSVLGAQVAGR